VGFEELGLWDKNNINNTFHTIDGISIDSYRGKMAQLRNLAAANSQ